jgi:HTH-type transcriptional regulator / antitoxin HipB
MVRISRARDLALYVRDRRRQLGMTQVELADAADVSRRWLSSLEAGKPTAEIGLVLRTLEALGVILDARPQGGPFRKPDVVDLDAHLSTFLREESVGDKQADTEAPFQDVDPRHRHLPEDAADG